MKIKFPRFIFKYTRNMTINCRISWRNQSEQKKKKKIKAKVENYPIKLSRIRKAASNEQPLGGSRTSHTHMCTRPERQWISGPRGKFSYSWSNVTKQEVLELTEPHHEALPDKDFCACIWMNQDTKALIIVVNDAPWNNDNSQARTMYNQIS